MKTIVIGFPGSEELAKSISRKAKAKYSNINLRHFPDGESHLKFDVDVKNKRIILVQSLYQPNEKITDILFAGYTAKDLKAKEIWFVAPYMAYMRQDKRFFSGECVSIQVISKLFRVFDEVVTIDPHLHRIHNLNTIFKKGARLSANHLISKYIKKNFKNPFILGPDEESFQWAEKIADEIKSHAIVLKKKRYNSNKVSIKIHEKVSFGSRPVIIVDDIISTGHTMIETVKAARKLGAKNIVCMCVHGIFADNAMKKLKTAGAKKIVCTNTIPGKTSKIDISGLVAGLLK